MPSLKTLLIVSIFLGSGLSVIEAADKKSRLGQIVEPFTLKDYRGKTHALAEFKTSKFVVIAFLGTECPLVKLYGPRLMQLANDFQTRGVQFIGVNSNSHDSITEVAAYARIHGIQFPILKDLGNQLADRMAAVRTPEVFVLDAERRVCYRGRIDDQYGVGYIRDEPKRNDLRLALDELLGGKPVTQPVTEAVGCFIGRVRKPKPNSKVTYSNQISRIFQKRCVECHRTGEIAPFALTKYEEVTGWAETIDEVIHDGRMPPWHANPKHGRFSNDRHMPAEEKQMVHQWVLDGAPEGDRSQLPKPQTFVTGWQLPRQPDQIIAMRDKPFTVSAEGTVKYQHFTVDPGFKEDKWVTMAEILPGNRAVVHHVLVMLEAPDDARSRALVGRPGAFLAAYVPGMRAMQFPPGMAKAIPAGSKFVFQVHYTPIGSVQQDLSKVGLVFADPKDVTHLVKTCQARKRRGLLIPAGAGNHEEHATSHATPVDVKLLSMLPHMHLRGKSFRYEARYPDGKIEVLLDVPGYDFNWQTAYRLTESKTLPVGTRMHCVAHYDNSENNLANPDPSATVRWGDETWNEMLIGYFDIAVPYDRSGAIPFGPSRSASKRADDARRTALSRAKPVFRTPEQRLFKAQSIIRQYDKNGDGKVRRGELSNATVRRAFDRLDANKDGVLTVEELFKSLPQ